MQVEKVGWMSVEDFCRGMNFGVETEHFKARVTWPNGYDSPERVEVTMVQPFAFTSDEEHGIRARDVIHDKLNEELDDLKRMTENLTIAVYCYNKKGGQKNAVRIG